MWNTNIIQPPSLRTVVRGYGERDPYYYEAILRVDGVGPGRDHK